MSVYKLSNVGGLKTKTAYTSFLAGNSQYFPDMYEAIATTTVASGGAASVTFSSIPSTYTHLQIRYIARGASNLAGVTITINSDTATNYASHGLGGNGSITFASGTATQSSPLLGYQTPSASISNVFAAGIADILDYANTNKYKTIRTLSGTDDNGTTSYLGTLSSLWQSTSVISTITLTGQFASSFAQYSSFALYGIKG